VYINAIFHSIPLIAQVWFDLSCLNFGNKIV
jgi:hypothetical protein